MSNKWRLALLLALLAPCQVMADMFVRHGIINTPTPKSFSVCYDHSCTTVVQESLAGKEWQHAIQPLRSQPRLPADERRAIAASVARLEALVGERTGTHLDKGKNVPGLGQSGQLDCIDESTNTTTYLRMLEQAGLLVHHEVINTSTRFGLFVGMPHTTAVIRETATGYRYAVDSWFLDNGQPPYIARLEVWKSGGAPGDE